MAFPLFNGLSDDYDRHEGTLRPYVDSVLVPIPLEKHNDIRSFHTTNVTVPWTLNDNTWWTGYRYPAFGIPQIGNPRSVVNVTSRGRTQAELDTFTQTVLDALTQDQIEAVGVTAGNEEWPSTDPDVTVGKDSNYRYANSLRVNITNLVSNGEFETDVAGWTDYNAATHSRVTTQQKYGAASMQVVSAGVDSGSLFAVTALANTTYTYTAWVFSVAGGQFYIQFSDGIDQALSGAFTTVPANTWTQITGTGTTDAHTARGVYVLARQSGTFFVDNVTLNFQKPVNSYYLDDLSTDFQDDLTTYYIELALRNFRGNGASTNLLINGGFETNTTGWTLAGTASIARDTTLSKFGTASLKITSTGAANYGAFNAATTISGTTAGRVYTASAWYYGVGATVGRTYQFELYEIGGASGSGVTVSNGTIVAGWQRVTATRTFVQNDRTGIQVIPYILGAAGAGETFNVDGVQVELNSTATPYIETNGAAASANALDLTNSYVDFSSDVNFDPQYTDSFSFASNLNNLTAGGDTFARWPRSQFFKVAPNNIKAIRLRLQGAGAGVYTFIAQQMRLVPAGWTSTNQVVSLDTKRGTLARQIPRDGIDLISFPGMNLLDNTSFEVDIVGVTGNNATATRAVGVGYIGNCSLQLNQTALGDFFAEITLRSGAFVKVTPGLTYTFSAFYRNANGNDSPMCQINWHDSSNAIISSTYPSLNNGLAPGSLLGGVWLRNQVTMVAPPGASYARLYLRWLDTDVSTGHIGQVDAVRFEVATPIPRDYNFDSGFYFYQTRPKDVTTYVRFNSGHLPTTGVDDNIVRQFFRYNPTTGDRIEVKLASRSTGTSIVVNNRIAGVTTTLNTVSPAALTAETDYFLVTKISTGPGSNVRSQLYLANGPNLGTSISSVAATTAILTRGYVGYSFEPYMYDFYLWSFNTSLASFGTLTSTAFRSRSLVKAATLYPRTSPTENLLNGGAVEAFADATVTTTDNNIFTVKRGNVSNQGGVRYNTAVWLGNSQQVLVTGKVFPVTAVNGTYRLGLIDENDSVVWFYSLSGLLPNIWNEFDVLLPADLPPGQYYLHVQQSGYFADTFRVRDLSLAHNSVGWEGSIDAGTSWQPFLNATDDRWSALKFITPGLNLELRATAHSDHAFIQGYNCVPRYVG